MSETAGFKKHHTPDVIDDDEEDFDEVLPSQDDNKYKTSWSKSNRHGTGHGLGTSDKEYHARMRSGRTPSSMYHSLEGTPDSDVSEMFDDDSKDVPSFDELPSVLFLTGDIDMKTLRKSYHKLQQNLLLKRIQEENMSKQSPHGSDRASPVEKQIKQNKNKNLKVNVTRSEAERNDEQFETQSKKPEHIKSLHNDEWTEAESNDDKQFKTQSKMPEHIKPLHNDEWTETERNGDKQFKTQSRMLEHIKPLHNDEWTEGERNDDKQFKTQSKKPEHIKPLHNDEWTEEERNDDKQFKTQSRMLERNKPLHNDKWTEEETESQKDLVRRKRLENLTALRKKYEANRQTEQHSPFKSKSGSISEDNRETVMKEETKLNDKEMSTSQLWSANNTEIPDRTVLREKHRTTFSTETTTEERKLEQETQNKEIQDLDGEVMIKFSIHFGTETNHSPKYQELESAVLEDKRKERELPEKPSGILHEGSDSDTDDMPYAMKILRSKEAHQIPSRVTGNKIKPLTKKSKKEVNDVNVAEFTFTDDSLDDDTGSSFTDDYSDEDLEDYDDDNFSMDIQVKSKQQSSPQKIKKNKNAGGPITAQKKSTEVHKQQSLYPHVQQPIKTQVSKGPVKNKNLTVNKNSDVKKQADEKKDMAVPQIRKPDKKPVMKSKVLKLHLDNVDKRRAKAFQIIKQGPYPRGVKCASCGRPDCNSTNIKKMKEMAKASKQYGFDMSDVAPDGNCMFAAVVDQMEFYGIRLYESKSLREAAVTWLIDNPNSEDGTPFASFLEQDWATYLQRMLGEGQWGDHIVLRAIVQVIGHTVKVMSVDKGEGHWTILEPSVMDKDKPELTLGHVGEFHYVSLQPSDHAKDEGADIVTGDDAKAADVVEDVTSIPLEGMESIAMFQEGHFDPKSGVPVLHLSYLLKHIIQKEHFDSGAIITSYWEEHCPRFPGGNFKDSILIGEMGNKTYIDSQFTGHRQVDSAKYLAIHTLFYSVSIADATSDTNSFILDESSVHPGYAKVKSGTPPFVMYLPSMEVKFSFKDADSESPELSAAFRSFSWPGSAQSWKTRARYENWPPQNIIDQIVAFGCVVKPSHHLNSQTPDLEWELGFDLAEKTLFREAVTQGQRQCYILLRILVTLTGELTGPLEPTYLRTMFLYACERIPTDFWLSNPGACLLYMLNELLRHFQEKTFPNYFVPTNNMIDHFTDKEIQEAVDKATSVRDHPLVVVLQFHSTYRLLPQGTKVYQMILNDIPKFLQHQSVKLTTLETFVPASIQIAREYLKAGHFDIGFERLSEIHEDRLAVCTCDDSLPYHLFLQDAVNGLDHAKLVWFSAYVDFCLRGQLPKPLVQELWGNRQELMPISEIIPVEIAGEFANTLLPRPFTVNTFLTCNEFAMFLKIVGKADKVKSVLHYAHEQYEAYIENVQTVQDEIGKAIEFTMMEIYGGLLIVNSEQNQAVLMKQYFPTMEKMASRLSSRGAFRMLLAMYNLTQDTEKADIIRVRLSELVQSEDRQGDLYFQKAMYWPYHETMQA